MRRLDFVVTSEYDNASVMAVLKQRAGLSSKLIRTLKHYDDGILLNGVHIRTVDPVHEGDTLTVNIPSDEPTVDSAGFDPDALDILYEDDDLVVVNKPADLAVHPSHNHQGDTLANLLAAHLEKEGKPATFRAVGRLDKGTSGSMVCATNQFAASKLQAQIHKTYFAIPSGYYEGSGTIDAPIYRPDPILTVRVVDERGDRAITHWTALATGAVPLNLGEKNPEHTLYNEPPATDDNGRIPATLVKVNLETGRTHQIRVHFASRGTPLLGDTMYGYPRTDIARQALHCGHAEFTHPYTGEPLVIDAPLPKDMSDLVAYLKK